MPPTWWQGGWRRQCFGSRKEVELFSQLAAVLMPQTPVCELFRSFPGVVGEDDLEPILTACGSLKDPNAALFVLYNGEHGKRDGSDEFQQALLAYGPPGSHILHISHTESRPLEDNILCVEMDAWHSGDEASLSKVLTDVAMQISLGLRHVLCPEVLEQLQDATGLRTTYPVSNLEDYASLAAALQGEDVKSCLRGKGFSPDSIKRMLKSAHLSGKCFEARLCSRIQWLLSLSQEPTQIAEAISTCSPAFGQTLQQRLELTQQRFVNVKFAHDFLGKAIIRFPSIHGITSEYNLEPLVQRLLDLGLSKRQVVKAIKSSPEVNYGIKDHFETTRQLLDLGFSTTQLAQVVAESPEILYSPFLLKEFLQWLLDFGFARGLITRLVRSCPRILCFSIEGSLKRKMQWFLDLGLSKKQVKKAITTCPQLLAYSVECNLKPKVEGLLDFGMDSNQVAKAIAASPEILKYNVEKNLKPKVQWFLEVGMKRNQVAKAIVAFPPLLHCSIQNMKQKVEWLLELGVSREHLAKAIANFPQILSFHIENLKSKVLWLVDLGLSRPQAARVISFFPTFFKYSIDKNLAHKQTLLQTNLGAARTAELVRKRPSILSLSYQRLKTRLEIVMEQKKTHKLEHVLMMTQDRFQALYLHRNSTFNSLLQEKEKSTTVLRCEFTKHFALL